MKNGVFNKKVVLGIFSLTSLLIGCVNAEDGSINNDDSFTDTSGTISNNDSKTSSGETDDYIMNGFYADWPAPTRLMAGIKTKKEQKLASAIVEISVGNDRTFEESFEKMKDSSSIDNGTFVSRVSVYNDSKETLATNDKIIDDFPNSDKYWVSYKTPEGTYDLSIVSFHYSYEYMIDFSKFNASSGTVVLEFGYYDETNNVFVEQIGKYTDLSYILTFKKIKISFSVTDANVIFSY